MKLLKRNILTAASSGVLLCMSATNSMAYEAPSLSFYPVASWSVSDMVHPQTGEKHCLLNNEYNNGFILQFQGSKGNIESLSIDLRQNAFQAGQDKTVTATLPGKGTVSLPAKAFNSDTLAINFSGQNSFFQNMKSASAVDIKIDENAFRFFTTGLANAAKAFDYCMNPASVPQAPVAEAQQPVVTEPVAEAVPESKVSLSEPVREAPSALMQEKSAAAQDQYAEELSVVLNEPKEKVSAELQKALNDQQNVMDDDALNKRPEPSAQRYTSQIAEQMGTAKEANMAQQPVVAAATADQPIESAEKVELPNAPKAEEGVDITWNGPAVTKDIEIQEPAELAIAPEETKTEIVQEAAASRVDSEDKSLAEDLQDWMEGDAASAQAPKAADSGIDSKVTSETIVSEPRAAEMDEPDEITPPGMEEIEKPPVVHSYRTPDVKVTKQVIKHEADFTNSDLETREVGAAEAVPPMSERFANARMQERVQQLERENAALNSELETVLRSGEKERLEISSDNWNLEKATMQFNEAERQISKLGQQIQKERAECAYEKKELEMMLFDPQVTEEAQLARLSSLEKKIESLQAQVAEYERQIDALKIRGSQ